MQCYRRLPLFPEFYICNTEIIYVVCLSKNRYIYLSCTTTSLRSDINIQTGEVLHLLAVPVNIIDMVWVCFFCLIDEHHYHHIRLKQ